MSKSIKPNEHVFIAGMTQSGKTFLMRNYLANYDRVFILDTKGEFKWPEVPAKEQISIKHLVDLPQAASEFRKVIYRPVYEELNMTYYDKFCEFTYKLKKNITVIDELMQVCPTSLKYPEWLKGIYTRGMELGVAAWGLTQRPASIPVFTYDSATHWFIFRLNNVDDRKRLAKHSGYNEFMTVQPSRVFWYFNTTTGERPRTGKLTLK